jgi:hypothetical protein
VNAKKLAIKINSRGEQVMKVSKSFSPLVEADAPTRKVGGRQLSV